ncbi:MAG: hypothetical protein ACYC3L_16350 [Gemmatimonadaceae bacterium]
MPRFSLPALLLAATALHAQQDDPARVARPERPTVATHAFAVARGYLEFEAGAARVRQPGERDASAIVTSKLGVAERLQFTLTTSVTGASPGVTAVDPVSAGLKWQLTPEREGRPTFALLPGITLANGPRRARDAAFSLMGVVSQALGPVAMDVNVAATRLNGVTGSLPYMWAASFGGALHGPLAWGLEFSGAGSSGDTQPTQMLGYLGYAVRPWLILDAGWSSPPGADGAHTIFAGVTYNAGRILPR